MPENRSRRVLAARLAAIVALLVLMLAGQSFVPRQIPDPVKEFTPQERQKLEAHASELFQAGVRAFQQGNLKEAIAKTEESLRNRESLYPKDRYPEGHSDLANSLNNLGSVLHAQGYDIQARRYLERALAMRESLHPKNRYPRGHTDLANSFYNLGVVLNTQGLQGEAQGYLERALAMRGSLYPKDRFPQGHPELVASLDLLGAVLKAQGLYREARAYQERSRTMRQSLRSEDERRKLARASELDKSGAQAYEQGDFAKAVALERESLQLRELYPKDRSVRSHAILAKSLNSLAVFLDGQGSYIEARGYRERALAMYESLYPQDRYPSGHPDLEKSLNNLGASLYYQGSYVEAQRYLERALAMWESRYSKGVYPDADPFVAALLNNLGHVLQDQGAFGRARACYERALAMCKSLYPRASYPQGHASLANGLKNLGSIMEAQGSYVEAQKSHVRALAMYLRLYPKDRYPQGHPDLASSWNNLGAVRRHEGAYGDARADYERALTMRGRLFPKDRYPQGHPALAMSLNDLGGLLHAQGYFADSAVLLRDSVDMQNTLARTVLAVSSEAEAMSYLARQPGTLSGLISVSLRIPGSSDETYRRIWNAKSALTQLLRDRQAVTLGRAAGDPALQRTVSAWRDTRAGLARLILATADGHDHPERAAMIKKLGNDKERLERELAAAMPEFARKRAVEQSRHDDLLKVLPEGTAVFDLLRFTRIEQDAEVKGKKGEHATPSYVGFVLATGQPTQMVDLGLAQPIEDAIGRWRQAVVQGQDDPAAADLRKLVWEPLARSLPKGTDTVYLAPDFRLCYAPWSALPGDRPGTVLLEQYALAVIPHAPFLLDRLTTTKSVGRDPANGIVLAVGGVAYGQRPKPVKDDATRRQLLATRPAETKRGDSDGWADLPGTLAELDAVSGLAASREIVRLQAADAGTAQLLQQFPRAAGRTSRRTASLPVHQSDPCSRLTRSCSAESAPRTSAPRSAIHWSSQAWYWRVPTWREAMMIS